MITGAIVQADDNDAYMLQYWDSTSGSWQLLYNVPAISYGYGLRTRPNADQSTYAPVGPVETNMLQFSAVSGDVGDAVSEIQVEGTRFRRGLQSRPACFFSAAAWWDWWPGAPKDRLTRLIVSN